MGLFDAYDPNTYGGSQGGLFDRLLASMQAPAQPGPGFPQSPMDANAAMPPQAPAQPQNSPIAVGDSYSMPRIGSGFAPLPDGSLPRQNAQERDARVMPGNLSGQPQAAPELPATKNLLSSLADTGVLSAAGPNFSDHMAAGYQNLRHGGGLLGSVAAAITGQRNDPQAQLQQQQARIVQQQYLALKAAGLPDKYAILASINPEAAKTILPQYVGADKNKFVQLKDGLGADRPAFVNETDQTINGHPIADWNKRNASDSSAGLGDMSKTGAAYLATLPAQQRGTVQAMVEGRLAPPSSFALSKPFWQNMIAAAQNVDPSFDSTQWSGRVAGVKSFKSGADAGTVRSANQVLGHISDLTDKADELHNGDYPAWNYVKNKWNSQTGADAANNWVTQAHAVADELSTFMKGAGHSSDTEIRQWSESLSPNMSPQQQRGAIKTLMGIYDHALQALEDKRTGAIGSVAAEKMGPLVTAAGQSAMDKVRKWAAGSAPGAGNTTKSGVQWSVVQ